MTAKNGKGSAHSIVDKVVRSGYCAGCGLCAGLAPEAISLSEEAPGYLRPVVGARPSPAAERAIAAACPGLVVAGWQDQHPVDPLWGPAQAFLTGAANDDKIRFGASSGGVITALLVDALTAGDIAGVLQIAMDPADPTRNRWRISRTVGEIMEAAGSRYAPSAPLADIGAILETGERLAFVGKPCDVSALRRLAAIDPRVGERFAFMLSFFCAGIPSQRGTDRIIEALGLSGRKLARFRYRGGGWPGYALGETVDGEQARMTYAESWGGILSKEQQFRCKICPDGIGGAADLVCADAWYGDDKGYPDFSEAEGRSLVIPRTPLGQRLLDRAIANGNVSVQPLDPGEIERMQPFQARRRRESRARHLALRLALQPALRMDGLKLAEASRQIGMRQKLHAFAGTLRRVLSGRR